MAKAYEGICPNCKKFYRVSEKEVCTTMGNKLYTSQYFITCNRKIEPVVPGYYSPKFTECGAYVPLEEVDDIS